MDEIEQLTKQGIREIHFLDDGLNYVKEHTMNVCKEIIKRKLDIVWWGGIRADNPDFELIKTMKESGCYCLWIGVESGSQEILDSIKKNILLSQVRITIEVLRNVGIQSLSFFMLGFPNETHETLRDTINFAKELNSDMTKFSIVTPLPGTELYIDLMKRKKLKQTFSDFRFHDKPVFELDNLKPEDIMRGYKKAYRTLYLNPTFIFKSIKKITKPVELKRYIKTGIVMTKMLLRRESK